MSLVNTKRKCHKRILSRQEARKQHRLVSCHWVSEQRTAHTPLNCLTQAGRQPSLVFDLYPLDDLFTLWGKEVGLKVHPSFPCVPPELTLSSPVQAFLCLGKEGS